MAAEGGNVVRNYRGDLIPVVRFTYTGAEVEVIPREATHIFVLARVIRREAFLNHRNIVEVICHEDVEKIEEGAFRGCKSLRRVIMPGVKFVEGSAFAGCGALEYVECDMLEIVGQQAFGWCESLKSMNLPSAGVVKKWAFIGCKALTDVKFGSKLERIEECAFQACDLERITIPLTDGLITHDYVFQGCFNLHQVDLIEGELHETIAVLHLEEWKNETNQEIDSINQILPNASAGSIVLDDDDDDIYSAEKAQEIRRWIRSVLRKIIHYQDEHQRLLNEAATILDLALPNDIVRNKVLPFLELPPHTFELEDDGDDEEEDSDDDTQSSESSLGDEEEE